MIGEDVSIYSANRLSLEASKLNRGAAVTGSDLLPDYTQAPEICGHRLLNGVMCDNIPVRIR